nr:ribonuclease H-like domain, reverse transcriptase, RNA-dependent DNA polymerase [Tanacetum cinerariifolium]
MVYLGSEPGSKAYRLFDPITEKICIRRDVKFKEDEIWNWEEYVKDLNPKEPEWSDFIIQNNKTQETEEVQQDQEMKLKTMSSPKMKMKKHLHLPIHHQIRLRQYPIQTLPKQAVYTRTDKMSTLLLGVYVDDLIVTGTTKKEIESFKYQMQEQFEMSDLGLLAYYLGIEEPQEQHMKAIKLVLRYIKGTKDYGITYGHDGNKIQGYSDSSYTQEGKGTTGIVFYFGNSPII